MYLHSVGEVEASFTKEDMVAGKHSEYERGLVEGFLAEQRKLNREIESNTPNQPTPTPPTSQPTNNTLREVEVESPPITPPPSQIFQAPPPPPTTTTAVEYLTAETFQQPQQPPAVNYVPPPLVERFEEGLPCDPHYPTHHTVVGGGGGGGGGNENGNNLYESLLQWEPDYNFDPFGETQKAFEDLIQQEVEEGERWRVARGKLSLIFFNCN